MRKGINLVVLFAFLTGFSPNLLADGQSITVKGVTVNGNAMSGVGMLMTFLAGNTPEGWETYVNRIGWGLIVVGVLIDSNSTMKANGQTISAKPVWNAVTSEARVALAHPNLIDSSSPIANAANKSGLSVSQLADLTAKVDNVTSAARTQKKDLSVKDVVASVTTDAKLQPIVANMATLALISN
jgi:hypothetical protein